MQYYPKPVVYSLLFSDVIALRDPGLENKRSRPLAVKQPVLLASEAKLSRLQPKVIFPLHK